MVPQEWIVLHYCLLDHYSHHRLHTTERNMGIWTWVEPHSRRMAHWRDSRSFGSHQSHFDGFGRRRRRWLPGHQVP